MTGFWLGSASGLKEIISDQVAHWSFGNVFVPSGITKIIVVDTDGGFPGLFKKTFQDNLLIPVHAVARGNHKEIRNEVFKQ